MTRSKVCVVSVSSSKFKMAAFRLRKDASGQIGMESEHSEAQSNNGAESGENGQSQVRVWWSQDRLLRSQDSLGQSQERLEWSQDRLGRSQERVRWSQDRVQWSKGNLWSEPTLAAAVAMRESESRSVSKIGPKQLVAIEISQSGWWSHIVLSGPSFGDIPALLISTSSMQSSVKL